MRVSVTAQRIITEALEDFDEKVFSVVIIILVVRVVLVVLPASQLFFSQVE